MYKLQNIPLKFSVSSFFDRLTDIKNILELKYCIIGVEVNEVKTCLYDNRRLKGLLLQFSQKRNLSP